MSRNRLVSFFFIALLIVILYQVCLIFACFFEPFFWACILAFTFYPIYTKLLKWLRGRESLSAFLTLTIILLTVIPLLAVIIVHLTLEASRFYNYFWGMIESGEFKNIVEKLRHLPIIQRLETHEALVHFVQKNLEGWILNAAKALGNFTAGHIASITKNIILFGFNFLLTLFLSFFFLKDGAKLYRLVYEITPLDEEDKKNIFKQIHETFAAVLQGQLLTALAQALTAGFIFWCLKLPLPIFFAALTFLAAFIPVIGTSLVWGSFVIYLVALQQFHSAVLLFFLGTFVISLVDNFLKPFFIGEKTKLPYLVLFLGILGGLELYGFVGIFLAPAFLALFFALIKIYRQKFL